MVESLVFGLFGALWRRWFGGWLPLSFKGRRAVQLAAAGALGAAAVYPLGWWALVVALLATLYWVPGHQLQGWRLLDWIKRYGPFGVYWWLANRYPLRRSLGSFVDGSFALAELAAGFSVYFTLALVVRYIVN